MPEFQRKSHAYSHLFHSKFVDHKQTNEKQNNFPSSLLFSSKSKSSRRENQTEKSPVSPHNRIATRPNSS